MEADSQNYWSATRHPWACLGFVLPLLALYELGIAFLHMPNSDHARNGADVWLRDSLVSMGLTPDYSAPAILCGILLAWAWWKRENRPRESLSIWVGMALESTCYALLLSALSHIIWQLLLKSQGFFASPAKVALLEVVAGPLPHTQAPEPIFQQLLTFVGAGLYEETLFRLILFSGLVWVFTAMEFSASTSAIMAGAGSAFVFAGAHHLGAGGEPFHAVVFTFRTLAGFYFTALFYYRGFGIAVGAHVGYDVVAGLMLRHF